MSTAPRLPPPAQSLSFRPPEHRPTSDGPEKESCRARCGRCQRCRPMPAMTKPPGSHMNVWSSIFFFRFPSVTSLRDHRHGGHPLSSSKKHARNSSTAPRIDTAKHIPELDLDMDIAESRGMVDQVRDSPAALSIHCSPRRHGAERQEGARLGTQHASDAHESRLTRPKKRGPRRSNIRRPIGSRSIHSPSQHRRKMTSQAGSTVRTTERNFALRSCAAPRILQLCLRHPAPPPLAYE